MRKLKYLGFLAVSITGILIGTFPLIPSAFAGSSNIQGRVGRANVFICGKRKFYVGNENNVHQVNVNVKSASLTVMANLGVETDLAIFFLDTKYNVINCYDGVLGLPPSTTLGPGKYFYIVGASIDSNNTTPPYISRLTW